MSRTKKIILWSVISTIMILIGAFAKIQHWDNIKPIMLIGMVLQLGVVIYALVPLVSKQKKF